MKTTQERLSEVYCVIKSDEDATALFNIDCAYLMHYPETWVKGDKVMVTDGMLGVWYNSTRTEIPVSHFIDLLNDSIVPWRLGDDGFVCHENGGFPWWSFDFTKDDSDFCIQFLNNTIRVWVNSELIKTNVKTYTDLITLIRLIG
jgi:hypothetical protein